MSRRPRNGRARSRARTLSFGLTLIVAAVLFGPRATADYPPQTTFGSCVLHVPSQARLDRFGYIDVSVTGDCRDTKYGEPGEGFWQVNGSPLNGWAFIISNGPGPLAWVNPARVHKRQVVTFTRAGAWPGQDRFLFCPTFNPTEDPYVIARPELISERGHPLYLRHRTPVLASCTTKLQQNQPQVEVRRVRGVVHGDVSSAASAARDRLALRPSPAAPSAGASGRSAADPYSGVCLFQPPARVVISQPNTVLPAKITGPCAASGGLAYWFTNPESASVHFATAGKYLDGAYIDINDEIDTTDWPMVWEGFGAWQSQASLESHNCGDAAAPPVDPAETGTPTSSPAPVTDPDYPVIGSSSRLIPQCTELDQNDPVTDIRLASQARIAVHRTGGSVTIGVSAKLYNVPIAHTFCPAALVGRIQYRERGSATWQTLIDVTTKRPTGATQITYQTSRTRDYRFIVIEPRSFYAQSVSGVGTA